MHTRLLAATLMSLLMTGCINLPISANNYKYKGEPPAPRIIPGQKATIHIYNLGSAQDEQALVDAWQQTGLFSSVSRTESRVPPASDVFIETRCTWNRIGSDAANVMMALGTLFLIHSTDEGDRICDTSFYQNGSLLTKTTLGMNKAEIRGLAFLPFIPLNIKMVKDNRKHQAGFVVVHTLSELSRRNP